MGKVWRGGGKVKIPIVLKVNGKEYRLEVKPNEILLNVLRDRLHLTGTKYGCGIGECGACIVLRNGKAIASCQTLAVSQDGQEITTIEGLAKDGKLHPLQETFVEEGAVQCGFCTSGMILSAKALLDSNPSPTTEEVKDAIRGNLCRCTGYVNIVRAIKVAAEKMRKPDSE
ncbi:MAG: (2Fe-2S)-binding protein [Deltaproteobacteria bacterium]|nr:(2Fe-2S)-binding protein [Deltaproteobacteria bacterium]MBW2122366.1 (2Fe-2S)-binding protein [Deltaproteobacteria bacterium]